MRISNIKGNSLYHESAHQCVVTLNGKEIESFVFADDDAAEGKVTYFDSEGKLVTQRGDVAIIFPKVKETQQPLKVDKPKK